MFISSMNRGNQLKHITSVLIFIRAGAIHKPRGHILEIFSHPSHFYWNCLCCKMVIWFILTCIPQLFTWFMNTPSVWAGNQESKFELKSHMEVTYIKRNHNFRIKNLNHTRKIYMPLEELKTHKSLLIAGKFLIFYEI